MGEQAIVRAYVQPVPLRFTFEDLQCASDEWGINCGPAAIAAMLELGLSEIRPKLGDFEQKGYTNPSLMFEILRRLQVQWRCLTISRFNNAPLDWPSYGLARVQWEGPWTAPGVPQRVRYRHTHWVGSVIEPAHPGAVNQYVFDVNCACIGGWVPFEEWRSQVVPWLLGTVYAEEKRKPSGAWHLTHSIQILRGSHG